MTPTIITSTPVSIPAGASIYGNFSLSEGNLYSVGFQNSGFVSTIYLNQLMITAPNNVFFQIENQSSNPVDIYIWGVTDTPTAYFLPLS